LRGQSTGSDGSSDDVDGDAPWVVGVWEIVTLGLNLNAHGVGTELSCGRCPCQSSDLGLSVTSVADTSVSGGAFYLGRQDRSRWGGRKENRGSNCGVLQVFIISNIINYDLLTDVSVESLLVVWGWEVSVWLRLAQVIDNQSGSGIDAGGVTGGAVDVIDAGGVRGTGAETVAESKSVLDIEEVIDGDPVSERVRNNLLGSPVSMG